MGHSSFNKYDNIEDAILIIDKRGKILYKNDSVLPIFEYTYNNFPENVLKIIPLEQVDHHREYIKKFKGGMSNRYIRYNTISGKTKTINITVVPKRGKTMIIIKDLTDEVIFKEFFNISKHLICTTTVSGVFLKVNPFMIEQLGCKDDGFFYGKTYLSFVHKDDVEITYKEISSLNEKNQTCNVTNRFRTAGNDYLYLSWDIKYIDRNRICYIALNMSDSVKDKKQLHLYKTFLDQTEQLIESGGWDWNVNTNELVWSQGLKDIYEIDDVNYSNYLQQNHPEDNEKIQNVINKCLIDESPYTIIHRVVGAKTGKTKYLKARGSIVKFLNERKLIGIGQDITETVMTEKTLVELKDKAIKNDNIKTAFIANISHELRTPLNGIIGITELLKNSSGLSAKQQEYIGTLDHSCGVLLSIINNVLDFSKIEKNESHVEISKVKLREFIADNTKLFKFNIEKKKLYFDVKIDDSVPEYIETDEMKLKQIIYNLLSNAFKFTLNGGISVHIFMDKTNLRLDVKDTGIGIEDCHQKNIFEPFIQADISITRKYGGTGLGLSICRSYTTLLKGAISFTSKVNVGTVFSVYLPLSYLKMKNDVEKYKDQVYICIVEDNMSNQYILKEIINDFCEDIVIEIFDNGQICLDEISFDFPPAIIFMDLHMPVLDGYSCTVALRELNVLCPIIGVSANHMSNERLRCIKAGMDDFLLKPINKKDIHDILVKYQVA